MNSKKALIYNKYLSTAGGGERACFDLAAALAGSGFDVIVASDDPLNEQPFEKITANFGSYSNIEYKKFDSLEDVIQFSKSSNLSLFVNHTYLSFIPNPLAGTAGRGVYLMMFPRLNSQEQVSALNTYDLVLSISEFSAAYLETYSNIYSELTTKHEVLVLPISSSHLDHGLCALDRKEKLIINIGRYNVRGHSKCQLDVIKLFKELKSSGLLDSEWSLICAGQLNKTPDNLEYFDLCLKEAEGQQVSMLSDITLDEMITLYQRASALIQMTGFDLPFGVEPEKCEHLGLVALDCLSYGVIPFCYQRSGISAVIRHAVDGFLFADSDELKSYIALLASEYKTDFHQRLIENMKQARDLNTFVEYQKKLGNML